MKRNPIIAIEVEHSPDHRGPIARVRRRRGTKGGREYHKLTSATRERLEHMIDTVATGSEPHFAVVSLVLSDQLWIGVVRI